MAEYIERDIFINNELIPLVKTLDLCHPKQKKGVLMAISRLKEAHAANVEEVVYCKNCKHLMFSDFYGECTKGYMGIVQPNDYCSKGERKESE